MGGLTRYGQDGTAYTSVSMGGLGQSDECPVCSSGGAVVHAATIPFFDKHLLQTIPGESEKVCRFCGEFSFLKVFFYF